MHRLFCLLVFAACTHTPSGATCPDNEADRPTYDNFGREFMETYCTSCHSAAAPDRHGAPLDQNYDSEADVRQHAIEIDAHAAAGPNGINTSMPDVAGPVHAAPSQAEREMLGRFLACEQQ
jgi:uncharacterized membrane protein